MVGEAMAEDTECPTCGTDGAYYRGEPRAETYHFLRRSVLDMHRARQAMEKAGWDELAQRMSHVIRHLEDVAARAVEPEKH